MNNKDDTIAAIATPIGIGGISVIRISGKGAIEKIGKIFKGNNALSHAKSHTAHYGKIVCGDGRTIDEIVATIFRSPRSYTSEDMVEISCHGGYYVTQAILQAIIHNEIRLAEPGEFTKRAFLSGRIDLVQAEAVADMINASTEIYHRFAVHQLEGRLSNEINEIRDKLVNLCSLLELELDFSEENLEVVKKAQIKTEIESITRTIQQLSRSYSYGKLYREGAKVAIVGKPNVGKSSILNTLLNENRAIVTEIPGTTRDIIEEKFVIDGALFSIADTAGIRTSKDIIESMGIELAKKKINMADIILIVVDPTQDIESEDDDILELIGNIKSNIVGNKLLIVNKIDIAMPKSDMNNYIKKFLLTPIFLSAKTGYGLNKLKRAMFSVVVESQRTDYHGNSIIINGRHKECLRKAEIHLAQALEGTVRQASNEFIVFDINTAINDLSEIIGTVITEEILNNIFSKFCIGK
jgi:tRNA modification GTPase